MPEKLKFRFIPVKFFNTFQQIVLNLTWQVVAGEESKEVDDQSQREMRVLEAIYPRPSSIPPKFDSSLPLCNDSSWITLLSFEYLFSSLLFPCVQPLCLSGCRRLSLQ